MNLLNLFQMGTKNLKVLLGFYLLKRLIKIYFLFIHINFSHQSSVIILRSNKVLARDDALLSWASIFSWAIFDFLGNISLRNQVML